MLGMNCARSCPDTTSGSYFRKLLNHSSRHEKQREGHMMLDFTKNGKSYDHIPDDKEKKTLSIERLRNTFSKHRSSSKAKGKRASESDAISTSSRSGIEIPNMHGDYSIMDFNPSPRSNNSNTSTNSDVALSGYLPMRPGGSLSFSSTCSADYVDMPRCMGYADEAEYFPMSPPTTSVDSISSVPTSLTTGASEGYVDMTQGSGGLSISTDSSSSSSINSRARKVSSTLSHTSSMELPSPQEDIQEQHYLHEIDIKTQHKDKKKSIKKSKESGKRKKSDPNAGDSLTDTLKSKGSSHFSTLSSFLTRKNSQSSSTRTPLSPTGSPLPKSSRYSSSPFASLGRNKNRDSSNLQSPTPGLPHTLGPLNLTAPMFSSPGSMMSPGNLHGFIHTLNPSFREFDSLEQENYCAMEPPSSIPSSSNTGGFPRNLSNRELTTLTSVDLSKHGNRASGSYDLSSSVIAGNLQTSSHSPWCTGDANRASSLRHLTTELNDRGCSSGHDEVDCSSYVNFGFNPENSTPSSLIGHRNGSKQSCMRKLPEEPTEQMNVLESRHSSDLERVSESSLEDGKNSNTCGTSPAIHQESSANYVNMCPGSDGGPQVMEDQRMASPISKMPSQMYRSLTPCSDRKILNTESINRYSTISDTSDYLQMDMRNSSNSNSQASSTVSTNSSMMQKSSANLPSTSVSVIKRPALPPLLFFSSKADPSVPLEKLTIREASDIPNSVALCSSSVIPCSDSGHCCAASSSTGCISFGERCRSHSGPGAPEASRSRQDPVGDHISDDAHKRESENRALSACSSPVSYSPPTSPGLASSSKSSLSEGGMSSASSTCTVVNVGIGLHHRRSHGSGSSTSNNNFDTVSSCIVSAPNPISSSVISISSSSCVSSQAKLSCNVSSAGIASVSSAALRQASDTTTLTTSCGSSSSSCNSGPGCTRVSSSHDVVYACLDLTPPKSDIVHSSSSSPFSKRRSLSGPFTEHPQSCAIAPAPTGGMDDSKTSEPSSLNYTEIDFKKCESIRNACLLRDALRH